MNVLFVCTGNTCRSPLAEVIAQGAADARGMAQVECASAGAHAFPGQPAAEPGVSVAAEHDLNLEGHRARELTVEFGEWADLIIGMDHPHVEAASHIVPDTPAHLMSDFLPASHALQGRGIPDPVGGERAVYAQTYEVLELAMRGLFDALEKASQEPGDEDS